MAIIVGDLHGDLEKTSAFLAYKPAEPHIALGDYLDSFTEPLARQLGCLQMLIESDAVLLLGNHEVHYLKEPLFHFAGYNLDNVQFFQEILENNINRFKVAHAVDGWLCTHAGVHQGIASIDNVEKLAMIFNARFRRYLVNRFIHEHYTYRYQSIFWYNYLETEGTSIARNFKQVFGHVELRRPEVHDAFIALDTTNRTNSCWLYDTRENGLVELELPPKTGRVRLFGGAWN